MKETGSIKFNCNWIKTGPLPDQLTRELNNWRQQLYALLLIGVNEDGIGYGNISCRYRDDQFIISGSGTGRLQQLDSAHYCIVTAFDPEQNEVSAVGPLLASSESMTHAMIYALRKEINCVMHVHHKALWTMLLQQYPSTGEAVAYGTPAMAREIARMMTTTQPQPSNIFAMAGHEDGVIAYGKDMAATGMLLLQHLHYTHAH